jgi:hypothetical protein
MNMKKILFCLGALLAIVACDAPKETVTNYIPPPPTAVGRTRSPGTENMLVLHLVNNSFKGSSGNTHGFFYDIEHQAFGFTDIDTTYTSAINFIPEVIDTASLGKAVTFDANYAYSFSDFNDDEKKEIADQEGIAFDKINDYRIARGWNIQEDPNSETGKQLLLDMLQQKPLQKKSFLDGAGQPLPVEGAVGILLKHPIETPVEGNDGKQYYVFYDITTGRFYITDIPDLYEKFRNELPMVLPKEKRNAVLVQVVMLDPIVTFKKESLQKAAKKLGVKIDGGGDTTKTFNQLLVGKIVAYGLIHDYRAVIAKLNVDLHPDKKSQGAAKTNTSPANNTVSKKSQQAAPSTAKKVIPPYDPNNTTIK